MKGNRTVAIYLKWMQLAIFFSCASWKNLWLVYWMLSRSSRVSLYC